MTTRTGIFSIALLAAATATSAAEAHTGAGAVSGFSLGFLHPLGGLDHMLAMVAVGLFACLRGGRTLWIVPAAFLGMMAIGGIAGVGGVGVPYAEVGIALSVVAIGGLVALGKGIPAAAAMATVGVFAVFHGHAHGTEMPLMASGIAYGTGFLLATAMLHGAGILTGLALARLSGTLGVKIVRTGGAAMAAAGIAILGGAV